MIDQVLSDEDIELLKRALSNRCTHLGISPDGVAAQFEAAQLMDLFHVGMRDEKKLAVSPIPMAAAQGQH